MLNHAANPYSTSVQTCAQHQFLIVAQPRISFLPSENERRLIVAAFWV